MTLPILIASDHAGFSLKEDLKKSRSRLNFKDLGPFNDKKTDYPVFAKKLCLKLEKSQKGSFGVLICGTGQGMAMQANRFKKIRAALCWSEEIARLSRAHNNANLLCLPGRFLKKEEAVLILDSFLKTPFDEKASYIKRLDMLSL